MKIEGHNLAFILVLVAVLGFCSLSVMTSIASAQEITVEGSTISTPTEQREGQTVDSVVVRDGTSTISVEIDGYKNIDNPDNVQLRRYQITDPDEIDEFGGEAKGELDLNDSSPGSYWIVFVDDDAEFVDVLPVVVPGYGVDDFSIPKSIKSDQEFTIEAKLSEKPGQNNPPEAVEVAFWNDDSVERQSLSLSGDGGSSYTATVTPSELDLSTSDYDVLISVLGEERTVGPGTKEQEPLAIEDVGTVSISESDNDDSDDDDDVSSDDSSSSGGGQGGGGAAEGQGNGDSTTESGPPTPQNVRDTLSLVDPANESTLNDDSSSTESEENEESDESQSSGNSESSVLAVEFEGETQHSVSVTDYGTPPQTVEEEVVDSIARYNSGVNPVSDSGSDSGEPADSDSETTESGSAADDGDSDVIEPQSSSDSSDGSGDTNGGSDIRVVSLSDISTTEEIGDEETTATVTFSVDRNEVTNPNQLTVYKEEYIFEAQEEQWIELETSVSETTGEEIEVSAETTEFSLFAVTETISEPSQPNGSNNETATSSQNNSTGTTDQTPGFGIISVVISILLIVVALSRPRSDADG